MKTFLFLSPKRLLALCGLAGMLGITATATAQTHNERVYATTQGWATDGVNVGLPPLVPVSQPSVTGSGNAITANLKDSTYLSTGEGGLVSLLPSATQYLAFAGGVEGGTPIHIKLSLPVGLLNAVGLLGNLDVGTFKGLNNSGTGGSATVTSSNSVLTSSNGLLDLLNGSGTSEIIITPAADCDGVYIKLSAIAQLAGIVNSNASIFHAYYINTAASGDAGCPKPIDLLSGVAATSGLVGIANVTGSVGNSWAAIDNDSSTYATMSVGAQVLSRTYLTALLNENGKANDSVTVRLQDPGEGVLGLLGVGLLNQFSIQPYLNNTAVGSPISSGSSLLRLILLPSAGNIYQLTVPITAGDFNRIEIRMGGVANVAQGLRVYEIGIKVPAPSLSGSTHASQYAYAGNQVTLKADPNANGDDIVWLESADPAATQVTMPLTLSGTASGTTSYYAASMRDGCIDKSGFDTVDLHIASVTTAALSTATVGAPYTGDATVALQGGSVNLPNTPHYVYSLVAGSVSTVMNTLQPVINPVYNANYFAMAAMPASFNFGPMANYLAPASYPLANDLNLGDDGMVTGTPNAAGTITFTEHVEDDANKDADGNNLVVGDFQKTINIDAALPVNLSSFHADQDANKNIVVTWTMSSEQNIARFDVLRSADGVSFAKIGSKAAAGTSSSAHTYTYTDKNPGVNSFYRLNIVYADNNVKSSDIIRAAGGKESNIAISPNPAGNDINISGINDEDIVSVNIYDAAGRLVRTATTSTIQVSSLTHGIYFVTVVQKDGTKTTGKFLKK